MSSYLPLSPTVMGRAVRAAVKKCREIKTPYRYIVCSGYSGAIIAAPVARILKKHLIIVRKMQDKCHGQRVEVSAFPRATKIFRYIK